MDERFAALSLARFEKSRHEFSRDCRRSALRVALKVSLVLVTAVAATCIATGNVPW